MITLSFMRHANSNWNEYDAIDFNRPISKKGIKKTKIISKYLEILKIKFDLIFCSPSKRTKQTLKYLLDRSSFNNVEVIEDKLLYDGNEENFLFKISKVKNYKNILVITHEPQILFFANYFLGHKENNSDIINIKFVTSSILILEFEVNKWSDISDLNASLKHFIDPNEI